MRVIRAIVSFCFASELARPGFIISKHDSGVTIDIPVTKTIGASKRTIAWRLFEAGIFLLVGTLIAFAVCEISAWQSIEVWLLFPFAFGLLCLVLAAHQRWDASGYTPDKDYVRQIAVSGDVLVRTFRDGTKTVWCADEIAALVFDKDEDIGDYPNLTTIVLKLRNGKTEMLCIGLEKDADTIGLALQEALHFHKVGAEGNETRIQCLKSAAPSNETRITG